MNPTNRLARVLILVLACLVWTQMATAQELVPGQRLRITGPKPEPNKMVGKLVWADQDSLVLESDGSVWALPRSDIALIERHAGRHGHTIAGALIGGLAAGVIVGQDMLRKPGQCRGSGNYGELCAYFLAGSVVGGAGLGALVGVAIRHDDWIPVSDVPAEQDTSSLIRERGYGAQSTRSQVALAVKLTFW